MHLVSRAMIDVFLRNPSHQDAEQALLAWRRTVSRAQWRSPADVKAQFGNASIVGGNRVVFNIKGNSYRLIVAFAYRTGWGYINFIGTHAQYDQVDAATVDLSK